MGTAYHGCVELQLATPCTSPGAARVQPTCVAHRIKQRHTAQLPTKVNKKTAAVTTAALHEGAAWAGPDYD